MSISRDRGRADELRAELLGPRRYDVLGFDEVTEVGAVLFGDPGRMSCYRLPPEQWYARGVRLLGRTCVEATPDVTAGPLAETVRGLVPADRAGIAVVDLFAGSANLLFHVSAALGAPGCGMENDRAVWERTDANLRAVGASWLTVRPLDWRRYFDDPLVAGTTVYVVSPPWGDAFSFARGLDLARTHPPVPGIIDTIAALDHSPRAYAVIQHTPVEPVFNVETVTDRHPLVGSGRGCFVVRVGPR